MGEPTSGWEGALAENERLIKRVAELTELTRNVDRDLRQARIASFVRAAFGDDQSASLPNRALRLLEESIEAFQSVGGDPKQAVALVHYVFGRPRGVLHQELGGVSVCVLALAAAAGLSADEEERREVNRVLAKPISHFQERNAAKIAAGFLATDLVTRTCQGCNAVVDSEDLLDITMRCDACRAKRGLPPRSVSLLRAAVLAAARETLAINGAPAPGDSDEVEFQARRIADRTIATLHGKPARTRVITCGGVDITDHVAAMYDVVVHSLDWGSRFLCVEEIESILTVAELAGFDNPTSTPTFKDGAISDSDFGAWHAQVRAKARAMLHEDGGEPVEDKHGPANTQQGAATPGHATSDQAAHDRADLDQAAGNVAEPQIDPTAHRVDRPPFSPFTRAVAEIAEAEILRWYSNDGVNLDDATAAVAKHVATLADAESRRVIRAVVAWLRNHAADFNGAVEYEKTVGDTRYAYVKQQTARVLADRIEAGDWRRFLAKEG